MKYFIILLFILFAQVSHAKFYPVDTREISLPKNYQKISSASVHFMSDSSFCSGTVVSSDGILLTAQHCFASCLLENGALKKQTIGSGERDFYTEVNPNIAGKRCRISVFTDRSSGYPEEAEVIATGIGDSPDPTTIYADNFELYKELISRGIGWGSGDFILLKVKSLKNKTCASVSTDELKAGDPVWAVSYPHKTERKDSYDADGWNKFVSLGKVTASALENEHPSIRSWVQEYAQDPEFLQTVGLLYNLPYLINSDLDLVHGSSGSGIINSEGKLIGVNIMGYSDFVKYYSGASVSLQLNWISYILERYYPTVRFSDVFNCQK